MGVWLVAHVILLIFQFISMSMIHFSTSSSDYSTNNALSKTLDFGEHRWRRDELIIEWNIFLFFLFLFSIGFYCLFHRVQIQRGAHRREQREEFSISRAIEWKDLGFFRLRMRLFTLFDSLYTYFPTREMSQTRSLTHWLHSDDWELKRRRECVLIHEHANLCYLISLKW